MNWILPVLRTSLSGFASLATATPAATAVPPTRFESMMRAARRHVRTRTAALAGLPDTGGDYDVPVTTPTTPKPAKPALIGTLAVGAFPTAVAVSSDGDSVYVVNSSADSVSVFDARAQAAVTAIPVGSCPYGVSLSPDGARAYITNASAGSVSVVDLAAGVLEENVFLGTGTGPGRT